MCIAAVGGVRLLFVSWGVLQVSNHLATSHWVPGTRCTDNVHTSQ
jgi:hypothetical protein